MRPVCRCVCVCECVSFLPVRLCKAVLLHARNLCLDPETPRLLNCSHAISTVYAITSIGVAKIPNVMRVPSPATCTSVPWAAGGGDPAGGALMRRWLQIMRLGAAGAPICSAHSGGGKRRGSLSSASEPWLSKRAPAVLITLSLGTLVHTHTQAGVHGHECVEAPVDGGKEELVCTYLLDLMKRSRAEAPVSDGFL